MTQNFTGGEFCKYEPVSDRTPENKTLKVMHIVVWALI